MVVKYIETRQDFVFEHVLFVLLSITGRLLWTVRTKLLEKDCFSIICVSYNNIDLMM